MKFISSTLTVLVLSVGANPAIEEDYLEQYQEPAEIKMVKSKIKPRGGIGMMREEEGSGEEGQQQQPPLTVEDVQNLVDNQESAIQELIENQESVVQEMIENPDIQDSVIQEFVENQETIVQELIDNSETVIDVIVNTTSSITGQDFDSSLSDVNDTTDFFAETTADTISDGINDQIANALELNARCVESNMKLNTCMATNKQECVNCITYHPTLYIENFKLSGSIRKEITEKICPEFEEFIDYCGCDACKAEMKEIFKCHCPTWMETSGSSQGILLTSLAAIPLILAPLMF